MSTEEDQGGDKTPAVVLEKLSLEELFALIHKKQAVRMCQLLEDEVVSPQALNAINKFLADNNITGVLDESDSLKKLSEGLEAYEDDSKVTSIF